MRPRTRGFTASSPRRAVLLWPAGNCQLIALQPRAGKQPASPTLGGQVRTTSLFQTFSPCNPSSDVSSHQKVLKPPQNSLQNPPGPPHSFPPHTLPSLFLFPISWVRTRDSGQNPDPSIKQFL